MKDAIIQNNDYLSETENLKGIVSAWDYIKWVGLTLLAMVLSVSIISAGSLIVLAPFGLLGAIILPFLYMKLSKYIAVLTFKVDKITLSTASNEEAKLIQLIDNLSCEVGIPSPQLGLFPSENINAFSVGSNKENALLCISTMAIEVLNEKELKALILYQLISIHTGRAFLVSFLQSVLYCFVGVAVAPLFMLVLFFWCVKLIGIHHWLMDIIVNGITMLVTVLLVIGGNMVVRTCSRNGVSILDQLTSRMIEPTDLIECLKQIKTHNVDEFSGKFYSGLMFTSKSSNIHKSLSYHPALTDRLKILTEQS